MSFKFALVYFPCAHRHSTASGRQASRHWMGTATPRAVYPTFLPAAAIARHSSMPAAVLLPRYSGRTGSLLLSRFCWLPYCKAGESHGNWLCKWPPCRYLNCKIRCISKVHHRTQYRGQSSRGQCPLPLGSDCACRPSSACRQWWCFLTYSDSQPVGITPPVQRPVLASSCILSRVFLAMVSHSNREKTDAMYIIVHHLSSHGWACIKMFTDRNKIWRWESSSISPAKSLILRVTRSRRYTSYITNLSTNSVP